MRRFQTGGAPDWGSSKIWWLTPNDGGTSVAVDLPNKRVRLFLYFHAGTVKGSWRWWALDCFLSVCGDLLAYCQLVDELAAVERCCFGISNIVSFWHSSKNKSNPNLLNWQLKKSNLVDIQNPNTEIMLYAIQLKNWKTKNRLETNSIHLCFAFDSQHHNDLYLKDF